MNGGALDGEPWRQTEWIAHTQRLLDSYRRWVGRELLDRSGAPIEQARRLYEAPFIVLSHGIEADPVLNFGNRAALDLWEMDLETFLSTPSRTTAEPVHRDERATLLMSAVHLDSRAATWRSTTDQIAFQLYSITLVNGSDFLSVSASLLNPHHTLFGAVEIRLNSAGISGAMSSASLTGVSALISRFPTAL